MAVRLVVDPHILAALPGVAGVVDLIPHKQSLWAESMRLRVRHTGRDIEESYFLKVSFGDTGREALRGEFEATSAMHNITPDFCPKPIAWGTCHDDPNAHFYLCKFYDFVDDALPKPDSFCEKLARLHSSSVTSPEAKFGFHCTTYNGDLPQDNTWRDSWEEFFANGLRHVLKIREDRAGPNAELDTLLPGLFDKVIPRLLRPMETKGRKIRPSLVHGDLWCGNTGVVEGSNDEMVYDPASFWAHNEYELGNWRPRRNQFTRAYFEAYLARIPATEPKEDFDDRNALYALRFNLHAAALFPKRDEFLQMVIDEMRRLIDRFPAGYTGEE